MPNFAQTIILGHLGADPEIRYTAGGTAIANFSVAVTEKWKDKEGTLHEETEWYRVSVFGPSVENYVGKYLHKGDAVMVRGKMKTRKWQDRDGNDRYSTDLIADRFGGVQGVGGGKQSNGQSRSQDRQPAHNASQAAQAPNGNGGGFNEDIPF